MAKEKRACCCRPFSRPPHFHDQLCNGERKTGLLLPAFFKATTFSLSTLLWPKKKRLAAGGLFQGQHIFTKKNGFTAAGFFQGHHTFTIRLVMAKEKPELLLWTFFKATTFSQRKTCLLMRDFFKATTFSRSTL